MHANDYIINKCKGYCAYIVILVRMRDQHLFVDLHKRTKKQQP